MEDPDRNHQISAVLEHELLLSSSSSSDESEVLPNGSQTPAKSKLQGKESTSSRKCYNTRGNKKGRKADPLLNTDDHSFSLHLEQTRSNIDVVKNDSNPKVKRSSAGRPRKVQNQSTSNDVELSLLQAKLQAANEQCQKLADELAMLRHTSHNENTTTTAGVTQTIPVSLPLTTEIRNMFPESRTLFPTSVGSDPYGIDINIPNTLPCYMPSLQTSLDNSNANQKTSNHSGSHLPPIPPNQSTTIPIPPPGTSNSSNAGIFPSPSTLPMPGINPIYAYTHKPEAKIILTKNIKYETWRHYLKLALESAGLLYLVDPTKPRPFPFTMEIWQSHRSRFCEIVGQRLQAAELNKIASIQDPVALLDRLDRLRRPPTYGRGTAALDALNSMKYHSIKTSPESYILLFENRIHECNLAGSNVSEAYASMRFVESIQDVLPSVLNFDYSHKMQYRLPFTPFQLLRDWFLGAVQIELKKMKINPSFAGLVTTSSNEKKITNKVNKNQKKPQYKNTKSNNSVNLKKIKILTKKLIQI